MIRTLLLTACLLLTPFAAVDADEAQAATEIRGLLSKKKLDEAEQAFQAALAEYPEGTRLRSLHYTMYLYLNRAERFAEAAVHAEKHVDNYVERAKNSPTMASLIPRYLDAVVSSRTSAGEPEKAVAKLDETIQALEAIQAGDSVSVAPAIVDLQARLVDLLRTTGQPIKADALAERVLKQVTDRYTADPNNVANIMAYASSLGITVSHVDAETVTRGEFLKDQSQKFLGKAEVFSAYATALQSELSAAKSVDDATYGKLEELNGLIADLKGEQKQLAALATKLERSFSSLKRRIDAKKLHTDLVGQPATPLVAESWVNGDELTDADLAGKVVLLDFWAVWCGPCIATFPHLRDWHERFAEEGLVIIGVTRYYQYDWNEKTERIKKVKDLDPAVEREAMVKFAEHHELQHRFAVMADRSLSEAYGVTGIPQAVLIDREGRVQMIRVGSGEQNAEDLEAKIEELLGQSAE